MTSSTPRPIAKNIRERLGLRPIINASGTMTALGASIMVPEAIQAMVEIASEWVEIDDLQRQASATIARLTGSEAGFIAACSASGLSMAIAGTMTGANLLAIERLPDRTDGLRTEVIVQLGHLVHYGAPLDQAVRLTGARLEPIGAISGTLDYHLREAIGEQTAAALYVVSHETVRYGMLPLEMFSAICHEKGIPVIVDAASEYDLKGFLARGADLVVYSGHKFLGGPTSGIVAGSKALVRTAYLQNRGLGRTMKVGKESIAGAIAALQAWEARDHAAVRGREQAALDLWQSALTGISGVSAGIVPDPTGNPLSRLRVAIHPASGFSAAGLAAVLAAGNPPVFVRDPEVERGYFELDPCNLHPGEAEIVAERLVAVLSAAARPHDAMRQVDRTAASILRWPD